MLVDTTTGISIAVKNIQISPPKKKTQSKDMKVKKESTRAHAHAEEEDLKEMAIAAYFVAYPSSFVIGAIIGLLYFYYIHTIFYISIIS